MSNTRFISKDYNTEEKTPLKYGFCVGVFKEIKLKRHSLIAALNFRQSSAIIDTKDFKVWLTNFEPISISNYRLQYLENTITYSKSVKLKIPFNFSFGIYERFLLRSKVSVLFDNYTVPYKYVNTSVLRRFDLGSVLCISKDFNLNKKTHFSVYINNQIGFVNLNNRTIIKDENIRNINTGVGVLFYLK